MQRQRNELLVLQEARTLLKFPQPDTSVLAQTVRCCGPNNFRFHNNNFSGSGANLKSRLCELTASDDGTHLGTGAL